MSMEQMEDIFASEVSPSNSNVSKRLKSPIHIFSDEESVFSDSEDEAEWAKHIMSIQPNITSLQSPYNKDQKEEAIDKDPTLVLNEVLKLCCRHCACCKKIEEYLRTLPICGTRLMSPSIFSEDSGFVTSNSNELGTKSSVTNKEAFPSKMNVISCHIVEPQKACQNVLDNSTVNQKNSSITNLKTINLQNNPPEPPTNGKMAITEISKRSYQNDARPKRVNKKPTQLNNKRKNVLTSSVILNIPKFTENGPANGEDSSSSLSDPFSEDEEFHQKTKNIWHNDLEKRNSGSQVSAKTETKKSTVGQKKKRLISNKKRTKRAGQSSKENDNVTSSHSETDEDIIEPKKRRTLSQKRKEPEYSRSRSEPAKVKKRYTDRRLSKVPIDTTANGNLDKALARKLARTGGLFSSADLKNDKDEGFRSIKTAKSTLRKLYTSDEWLSSQEFLSQFESV